MESASQNNTESASNGSGRALSPTTSVHHRLQAGEAAMRMVRCRVSGTLTMLGTICGLASHLGYTKMDHYLIPRPVHLAGFALVVKFLAVVFIALVPLPGDLVVTRFVLLAIMAAIVPGFVISVNKMLGKIEQAKTGKCAHPELASLTYCWGKVACQSFFVVVGGSVFILAFFLLFQRKAHKMQAKMWRLIGVGNFFLSTGCLANVILEAICGHQVTSAAFGFAATATCTWIAWNPHFRQRVQARLANLYTRHGATAAAASIAGLMSGCSPKEALQQASQRFRAVPAKDLTVEDFRSSPTERAECSLEEQPGLMRTVSLKLGDCDAFLSHSWHDSAEARCAALQSWRLEFLEEHGREPVVWFDKLCIDQNDIEADLRGLPIFLSGCKELLVLNGPTYLSRLWCIMELFTFVHMGGSIERIRVAHVLRRGSKRQDVETIQQQREIFDARHCDCLRATDKERMLTIVMAAFGDVAGFNNAVTRIMTEAGLRDQPDDLGRGSP